MSVVYRSVSNNLKLYTIRGALLKFTTYNYVNDSSKGEALVRFAKFIDKTGFQSFIPKTEEEEKNKEQRVDLFKPTLIQLKQSAGSRQIGDTIMTNMATLYDVMMGDFYGTLKFYSAKDNSDKIYIAVTGFVSNSAFGGNFSNLQMQKGGKGVNWAQKSLFKQINKHVLNYSEINTIL